MNSATHADPRSAISDGRLFLVVVAACLAVVGVFAIALGGSRKREALPPDRPRTFGDFMLTDSTGRTVTRGELNGRFCVVSFVFTSCGFTCREVTRQMASLQRLVSRRSDVRLVSLTVDPLTDTPEVLAKFSREFGAQTNGWVFLTGPRAEIVPLIEGSFLPKDPQAARAGTASEFLYIERIALVDPAGSVCAYFNGLNPLTPRAIVDEIDRLRDTLPHSRR